MRSHSTLSGLLVLLLCGLSVATGCNEDPPGQRFSDATPLDTGVDTGSPDAGSPDTGVDTGPPVECTSGEDCDSGVCMEGSCVPASCDDEVKNQDETDVDCGGDTCEACAVDAACSEADDCTSGVCEQGTCAAPDCEDGTQNGEETDVDCGGGSCQTCSAGKSCQTGRDCVSGRCTRGTCQQPTGCRAIQANRPSAGDGAYTIDPDGSGGVSPFKAYCDMTTDGGGWIKLVPIDPNGDGVFSAEWSTSNTLDKCGVEAHQFYDHVSDSSYKPD